MNKIMYILLLALLSFSGMMHADEAEKKSIVATVFGEKPDNWFDIAGGGGGSPNAASMKFEYADEMYRPVVEKYFHFHNGAPIGPTASFALNPTSKISLGVEYQFANATQSIDISSSSGSQSTGELKLSSSPIFSVNYSPVQFWHIKPYIGAGFRKLSLTGDSTYVSMTKIETGEDNWLLQAGVKFPIVWLFLGSLDYKHSQQVILDTEAMPLGHLKTYIPTEFISAALHFAF